MKQFMACLIVLFLAFPHYVAAQDRSVSSSIYSEPDAVYVEAGGGATYNIFTRSQTIQVDDYIFDYELCDKGDTLLFCLESEMPIFVPQSLNTEVKSGNYSVYAYYPYGSDITTLKTCEAQQFRVIIHNFLLGRYYQVEINRTTGLEKYVSYSRDSTGHFIADSFLTRKSGSILDLEELCWDSL